jgi:hypothetical protein
MVFNQPTERKNQVVNENDLAAVIPENIFGDDIVF